MTVARPGPQPALARERERAVLAAVPVGLFIDGTWRPATGGGVFAVEDPATGDELREVADATPEDALAALAAASGAAGGWRRTAPRERADLLRRVYELLIERRSDLALLMTCEMGKPLAESVSEVDYAAGFLRWYSEEAVRINGRFAESGAGGGRVITMRQAVGPCLFVTPWNFPLAMGARKVAPALAAGCTCVVKPAAQTPLTMLAFADLLHEAGVPAGVVNIVTGSEAASLVSPLLADPRLRKISFTGSTGVGKQLVRASAEQLLRVSMELGGNAPFLVFADADLDTAVDGAVTAKMRNGGEACTAANRFLVHASVADEFADRLATRLGDLVIGRGTESGVQLGPLIDARQRDAVAELVDDAVRHGARLLCGGRPMARPGYFYPATVLTDVRPGTRILDEEIFGPVAPVVPFSTDAEAVAAANESSYGLAAYLYTRDIDRAFEVAGELDTGMVAVNQGTVSDVSAPFGGIKQSGFGREGGPEGIDEYLEIKYLALKVGSTGNSS